MKLKKGKAVEKMAKKHVEKKHATKKKKKSVAEITTDDFFNQDFENMELDSNEEEKEEEPVLKKAKHGKKGKSKSESSDVDMEESKFAGAMKKVKPVNKKAEKVRIEKLINRLSNPDAGDSKNDNDSDSDDEYLDPKAHKKALYNLKEVDPEFFNYLKANDAKLLDFNVDDEIDQLSSADESEQKHVPDLDGIEVGSDESDFEADKEEVSHSGGATKVTFKLIKEWQEEIQKDKSSRTIKNVVMAFHAAMDIVSDSGTQSTEYKVEGAPIFNGIIQLCMMFLPDAFKKFLKIQDDVKIEAHKTKRFPKVKGILKTYLSDLIKVIDNVSSADIISILLKHLHQMLPYTESFSSLRKPLLRLLLRYWSTGEEETVRVVAYLCIIKIATNQPAVFDTLLKTMYIKYVENSKFVSPSTMAGINFMRRSLVEMYLLDTDCSYYHAFLYVRQLAIHLRNALTLKKKEHFQAVYNWQYINSLWFWSDLIARSKSESLLRHLLYPLVQITIGVVNLIPTGVYYPLRFHCVRMLINISRETNTFIPSLPLLVQILEDYDFNRKHTAVSMKPISLMCMLRVSKSQQKENGYKDALIENVYELILESAAKDGHTIYFPDMYIFCIVKIKEFLKKCNVANYCRKLKQLLDKIEENRKFIETERAKRNFDLRNMADIEKWEKQIKEKGTPTAKFYDSWIKVYQAQKLKILTQNDQMADYKLPTVKKTKRPNTRKDSDEDSDLEIPVEEMERRLKNQKDQKKAKKTQKAKKAKTSDDVELPTDNTDIVEDMKGDDWD